MRSVKCKTCEKYPTFTAEKQIALLKVFTQKDIDMPFEEAIAFRINQLWQDLTPEEKQQVKGILE